MGTIEAIVEIDFISWIITGFLILSIIIAIYEIISKICAIIGKPIGWKKQRDMDHDLILKNAEAIKKLAEVHERDNAISDEHDNNIQKELTAFMEEIRYKIEQIAFDRINDREKSREIRADLAGSIKIIAEDNEKKEQQINVLLVAQKEVLAGLINERYKQYINLQGIPEDELDEFVNLHQAYKACGGNSVGDAKYEYCIKHLPVIPSGRKLEIKHRT